MKDDKKAKATKNTLESQLSADEKDNKLKTDKTFYEIKKTPAMVEDAAELADAKSRVIDKEHKHDSKIPVAGLDDQFENWDGDKKQNKANEEDKKTDKEADTEKKTK